MSSEFLTFFTQQYNLYLFSFIFFATHKAYKLIKTDAEWVFTTKTNPQK